MALLSEEAKKQGNAEPAQGSAEGVEFLNQFAGQGTKEIGANATAIAYLSITNSLSDAVASGAAEEGVFYNSGTGHALGTEIRVIPVAFKTVWDEKDAAGKTLNRYNPKDINVQMVPPPPGKPGYPTMINPDTGNKVIETFAYALVLPDDPDAGFAMLTAGIGSMKAFRNWNTKLKQMKLLNGDQAPIFSKVWRLVCGSRISKTTGKPFNGLESTIDDGWVNQSMFTTLILPAREQSTQLLLTAPTGESSDAEAAE